MQRQMFLLSPAGILARSILDSPAWLCKGLGENSLQEKNCLGFSSEKINEVRPEVQRKVEAADKGYIPTISMNQPYLSHLKKSAPTECRDQPF